MCKIAIIENYPLFSSGIRSILKNNIEFDIFYEARTVDELIQKNGSTSPDIIIIDTLHFENEGIKPIRKIKRNFPLVPILLITGREYARCFQDYLSLGVKGFIFKDANPDQLIKAVKKISKGEDYFRKNVWEVLKFALQNNNSGKFQQNAKEILTKREKSVLKLFCGGMTYKEIASKLFISPRTVETHKQNILKKLNIHSTAEMVKYAYQNHILT